MRVMQELILHFIWFGNHFSELASKAVKFGILNEILIFEPKQQKFILNVGIDN